MREARGADACLAPVYLQIHRKEREENKNTKQQSRTRIYGGKLNYQPETVVFSEKGPDRTLPTSFDSIFVSTEDKVKVKFNS